MSEKLFHKNLALWAHVDPKQAVRLQFQAIGKHVEDSLQEAQAHFAELDLHKVQVLYVYGIGQGAFYEAARPWLKKDQRHRLVFLEDDLGVLISFFQTELATRLLQDSHVQLLHFENLNDTEAVFEVLYWNFALTRIVVTALPSYAKDHAELYGKLRHKITYDAAVKNALVDEYLRYGGAFFINFYQNMLSLPGSYLGNKTFGTFRKVPAIICGAGPSLAKSLPILKDFMDKALVFAGGSALNALNAAGLQPHLGAGIDPNPAQFERLSGNQAFEVPFYYRNRMYHDAFEMIRGPRLYITGCGGYDVSDYFEERLKIEHEFLDEGHNVINFCLQMALQLGCNPIIFVGMDLAFTGMQSYAPGVEENVQFDPESYVDIDDFDAKPLLLKDIYGDPLYTLWKWVAEADWIGEFAKEHPELTILNATEGGLGFPGVPNFALKEVAEQYLEREYPISDRLQSEIQNSRMPRVTFPKVTKLMHELRESLVRCISGLDILLEETKSTLNQIKMDKQLPVNLQSGRAALVETDLAEEVGFQYVLEIFNQVQARLYNRNLQELKQATERKRFVTKLQINEKRFIFLRDVAKVNVGLIDLALERKKEKHKKRSVSIMPDPALPIYPPFETILLPSKPSEGEKLPSGHRVSILKQYGQPPEEIRLKKEGILDGQCLLYYSDGKIKMESHYSHGRLNGTVKSFSPSGGLLTISFYVNGKLDRESKWYYPSGALYAIHRNRQGVLHGQQEYFYENGAPKTLLNYAHGVLQTSFTAG